MKPLYTKKEFELTKSTNNLSCECYNCVKPFLTMKNLITYELKHNKGKIKFCSHKCYIINKKNKCKIKCINCNNEFERIPSQINIKNNFCSQSCSTTYNNKNKNTGNRRSKLEIWLEEQLTNLYTNLDIHFNRKDTIGSELDIYIPSLNIAFELNGVFHYEPIYGINKLNQIQNNDISKSKACHDIKIDLCIIDTSSQKYVKPSTSQKYLDIINNIIKERF